MKFPNIPVPNATLPICLLKRICDFIKTLNPLCEKLNNDNSSEVAKQFSDPMTKCRSFFRMHSASADRPTR